jgi:two-component system, chemotaxis family, sensor kinase CheA
MNTSELLDQFIQEARECLEADRQAPAGCRARSGRCRAAERPVPSGAHAQGQLRPVRVQAAGAVVHAGEDLLDRVRNGTPGLQPGIADALLDAMDYSRRAGGPDRAGRRAVRRARQKRQALAAALRQHLAAPAAAPAEPMAAPGPPRRRRAAPPAWAADPCLPRCAGRLAHAALPARARVLLQGRGSLAPGPHRARPAPPGRCAPQQPWPAAEAFDCYQLQPRHRAASATRRGPSWRSTSATCPSSCSPRVLPPRRGPRRAAAIAPGWPAAGAPRAPGTPARPAGPPTCRRARWPRCAGAGQPAGLLGRRRDAPRAAASLAALPADAAALATCASWAPARTPLPSWARGDCAGGADRARRRHRQRQPPGASAVSPSRGRPPTRPAQAGHKVLKVGQDKIDRLMDLIGEMVVAKNALPYLAQRAEDVFGSASWRARSRPSTRSSTASPRTCSTPSCRCACCRWARSSSASAGWCATSARKLGKEVNWSSRARTPRPTRTSSRAWPTR